jgi:hypothetical protein
MLTPHDDPQTAAEFQRQDISAEVAPPHDTFWGRSGRLCCYRCVRPLEFLKGDPDEWDHPYNGLWRCLDCGLGITGDITLGHRA